MLELYYCPCYRCIPTCNLLNVHSMMTFHTSFRAEDKSAYKQGVLGWAKLLSVSRKGCTLCRASLSMAFSTTHKVHTTQNSSYALFSGAETYYNTKERAQSSLAGFTKHHAPDKTGNKTDTKRYVPQLTAYQSRMVPTYVRVYTARGFKYKKVS